MQTVRVSTEGASAEHPNHTGTRAGGIGLQIIEAVRSALLASLQIPEWDRDVVVDLYDSSARITPTCRSERYTCLSRY
jgi:hypothetical protein